jgi:carboxylesterase type B
MGGALHGTELPYVFGTADNFNNSVLDPDTTATFQYASDNATSASMINYWSVAEQQRSRFAVH